MTFRHSRFAVRSASLLRRGVACAVMGAVGTGCFTVYQPLVGLQRPVAIDPQLENFVGLRLLVRCLPTEDLPAADAEFMCRKLQVLFANQGAQVETDVPRAGGLTPLEETPETKPELVVDIRSRRVHEENSPLLWLFSFASLTLIPAITDSLYSQDITIRDDAGFMLLQDTLQGRFVRYFGFGVWAVNGILDLIVRKPEERLTTDGKEVDFSRDFYGQLTQAVFHARMRRLVQRGFEQETPRAAPAK